MHLAPLIRDLAVILGVAASVTFLCRLLKQPVVLGYIVAGIIVSPFTPPLLSVTDLPNVQIWAELGVIFFMFAMGLEFSFRKLAHVGVSAVITGVIEVPMMILLGFAGGRMMGWNPTASLFLGAMIAISSTTIILKTFEEMAIKKRHFAQSVFGILVVEDLAAILILVALSSIVNRDGLSGSDFLITIGRFAVVVGAWFMVGMVVVPRFVKGVGKHGNDEMLTILAVALCLTLVVISAYFQYSAALGAFLMGSILAETAESERIEHLIRPLRDVFGAIFFVSVGMLMNPAVLTTHYVSVIAVSAIIILGKPFAIIFSSLLTGQSLQDALRIGFSMAQVGEFSFIIASLGVANNVISAHLYPVIVASSLVTTFTTPFMIRGAIYIQNHTHRIFPKPFLQGLGRYTSWLQTYQRRVGEQAFPYHLFFRWAANAIVCILIFSSVSQYLLPWLLEYAQNEFRANVLGWVAAIGASSPFIWGMFQTFVGGAPTKERSFDFKVWVAIHGSRLATVWLVGILSFEFLHFWVAIMFSLVVTSVIFIFLRRQLSFFYDWFEREFRSGFHEKKDAPQVKDAILERLAPWNAHLVSIKVHPNSPMVAKRLVELKLRESYGLNVVVIQRGEKTLVAPKAEEIIFPYDDLLFLGTDEQVEVIRPLLEQSHKPVVAGVDTAGYQLRQIIVKSGSVLVGHSILDSGIRERYGGMVVGIEKQGQRLFNPKSDYTFAVGDIIWVVGNVTQLQKLADDALAKNHL